ncbi:UbiH/UbiF family hydroxylase [Tepidamorphus sp. 3E244]|uniref:UbiH/UbiF family hydroxylase n=1 Tax=Tepidamorphus sp. 3E244 TaxID=3385498 RepID=UPI0038FC3307
MANSNQTFDLGVAGGGPAGLATALLAARAGLDVALVAPKAQEDHRTFALMAGAVRMLQRIGVWERVASSTAPLRTLRIIDDTGRLLRAPTVEFHADEIDLDAFAWNFPAGPLVRALEEAVADEPRITRFETNVSGVTPSEAGPILGLGDGTSVAARAIAAADGRGSICREAAGIAVDRWSYPQTALVTTIEHDRPHGFVSTEFHRRTGPYTLVPLPGQRSSVVLVETAKGAEDLMALDDDALGAELSRRSHRLLGQVRIAGPRAAFPLSGLLPRSFAQNGIALIGEAAHVVPPIGAQGLNLGLRDAAMLAECLTGAPDPAAALQDYDRRRRTDVVSRSAAIDLLNRSLLSDLVPAQAARSLGLFAMSRIEPLRQRMMREGVAPADATLPAIMRADDDTPSARFA